MEGWALHAETKETLVLSSSLVQNTYEYLSHTSTQEHTRTHPHNQTNTPTPTQPHVHTHTHMQIGKLLKASCTTYTHTQQTPAGLQQ